MEILSGRRLTFLAVLLPGPAAAYPAVDTTFANGSTEANLTFGPGATSLDRQIGYHDWQ